MPVIRLEIKKCANRESDLWELAQKEQTQRSNFQDFPICRSRTMTEGSTDIKNSPPKVWAIGSIDKGDKFRDNIFLHSFHPLHRIESTQTSGGEQKAHVHMCAKPSLSACKPSYPSITPADDHSGLFAVLALCDRYVDSGLQFRYLVSKNFIVTDLDYQERFSWCENLQNLNKVARSSKSILRMTEFPQTTTKPYEIMPSHQRKCRQPERRQKTTLKILSC